jgi:hypothetical protein
MLTKSAGTRRRLFGSFGLARLFGQTRPNHWSLIDLAIAPIEA